MALLGFTLGLPPFERAKSRLPSLKLRRPIFGLLLFILSFTALDVGHAQESKEYQLKAAFLFNFAQFVKWPPGCFAKADAPFCIGILGNDPFGNALDETVRGEAIENHKLIVVRAQRVEDLEGC